MGKYNLIITEKPDAANRIAIALDAHGSPQKNQKNGVPYYHANCGGAIVVVPALGHLYTVAAKQRGQFYPVFDYGWVPRWRAERGVSKLRVWLDVISQLAKDAEGFVDACDFDVEGSIIGYTILKYACRGKEASAKRMKYSTLTNQELQDSYANLLPHLDFALVEAGLTRHEVDWLYGINLSRALTQAAKNCSGQYATLSTGRVQGPTLGFLEDREKTINCFVPTPYWAINAKIEVNGTVLYIEYEKTITTKADASAIKDACKAKEGYVKSVETNEYTQNPPSPFDLGALQREAYRLFKYSPSRTSSVLQKLYLAALISYPRTSSQKLPPAIGYAHILKKLGNDPEYRKQTAELISKSTLIPVEGKKFDPAHPAVYPTGNMPNRPLATAEKNLFDLVVKRFLVVFAESAIRQTITVTISISGYPFKLTGTQTLKEGWLRYYHPYVSLKDSALPTFIEGQTVDVKQIRLLSLFTAPPPRFNPRSLLQKMEQQEIGTKATRGAIIQTLLDRKYMTGTDRLAVSELGSVVFDVLSTYCSEIVSLKFTRKLEEEMNQIQLGSQTKECVLQDVTQTLTHVMATLKQKESIVGAQLARVLQKARLDSRIVGACPNCHDGKLVVLRSKKTGKRFVGCTNFFGGKCNNAYPLPQTGIVKPLSRTCKSCGSPMVSVYLKGKRAWQLCLNLNCVSKGAGKNEM